MAAFETYRDRFEHVVLEREGGVLLMRMHSGGEELKWGAAPGAEIGRCFAEIAQDPDNEIVILTGTRQAFCDSIDYRPLRGEARTYPAKWSSGRSGLTMLDQMMAISCPMIAAVNGPARVHSELAVLCDIVLASPQALFQDIPHFPAGLVPGDGVHVIWPMLLGPNRGRYFLLTGQEILAEEALGLGIVNEVVAADQLIERARALAALLMVQPKLVRHHTRRLLMRQIRRAMFDELEFGLMSEHHAWTARGPVTDLWP